MTLIRRSSLLPHMTRYTHNTKRRVRNQHFDIYWRRIRGMRGWLATNSESKEFKHLNFMRIYGPATSAWARIVFDMKNFYSGRWYSELTAGQGLSCRSRNKYHIWKMNVPAQCSPCWQETQNKYIDLKIVSTDHHRRGYFNCEIPDSTRKKRQNLSLSANFGLSDTNKDLTSDVSSTVQAWYRQWFVSAKVHY